MAKNSGFWGIEIGQAGLKAIRLRYADAADQVIAVAFDYVPHPKILSQPDAIPEELIPQALEKFLSRNDVRGDAVAISVPGQTALSRFIQLPPVEASKIAEIVKYEARQQIPFALEDVIWDYQPLGSGVEESGYMLNAEVGLFAMKRDDVMRQLRPFTDAKVEVELIQIAPLALYNVLTYDILGIRPGKEYSAGDEYTIMLDMGADNTTLVVSNGEKIWIRNVPIGGNHFTRALTKEMKLTFAKAEHLKCNATKSPDPRAVFQALRPVFNDYVSEIQRSIGYFSSVNRDAKVTKVVGMGNGFKLAGLQKFLQQNLQYEVKRLNSFNALVGDSVLNASLFQDNILGFGVPYGLALQAMERTRIHTTLLPPEIKTARLIRRKKPWAVSAAAALLFFLAVTAAGYSNVYNSVSTGRFGDAEGTADAHSKKVGGDKSSYDSAVGKYDTTKENGNKLVAPLNEREYWMEVYKAINECLPKETADQRDVTEISKRNRIKLTSITAEKNDDLSAWYGKLYQGSTERMLGEEKETPASGEGYVFTLQGVHYHHEKDSIEGQGDEYVARTLLKNMQQWTLSTAGMPVVPVRKIGIQYAVIVNSQLPMVVLYYPGRKSQRRRGQNAGFGLGGYGAGGYDETAGYGEEIEGDGAGYAGADSRGVRGQFYGRNGTSDTPVITDAQRSELLALDENMSIEIRRTTFTMQFIWKPTPKQDRLAAPPTDGAQPEGG